MDSNEYEELGGSTEVAEILGISKQQLTQLRARPDFPPHYVKLASGPVWKLKHIRRWMTSTERRSRGRPSTGERRILGKRFELEEPAIGSGGFADVYKAKDRLGIALDENSMVAVKILKSDIGEREKAKLRFMRELRLLQGTQHPHVIPIIAWGDDAGDGNPWYAMPLAQGSLGSRLKFIADNEIIDIMRQICAGLQYLHEEGIVHRDLTPMNVLLTQSGIWAISDFGFAREVERQTPSLTSSTEGFGTWLYMAPEAEKGVKFVREPGDIYSLGKVLHTLVIKSLLSQGSPIPPSPFRHIIVKATAFSPEERYSTVQEMLADIPRVYTDPKEITGDIFNRLRERVRDSEQEALNELLEIVLNIDNVYQPWERDKADLEPDKQVFLTMAHLTTEGIVHLWEHSESAFREAFQRFTEHIAEKGYPFEMCDTIADFTKRTVQLTRDDEILKNALLGLCELGARHNRWHVRSVFLGMLQEINTEDEALIACDALRDAERYSVEWNFEEDAFLIRSFHPVLRDGVRDLLGEINQDTNE
jgi:serine/threonine protein kinase